MATAIEGHLGNFNQLTCGEFFLANLIVEGFDGVLSETGQAFVHVQVCTFFFICVVADQFFKRRVLAQGRHCPRRIAGKGRALDVRVSIRDLHGQVVVGVPHAFEDRDPVRHLGRPAKFRNEVIWRDRAV